MNTTESQDTLAVISQVIGGQRRPGDDTRSRPVINPANDTSLGTLPFASADDVADALRAAQTAQADWQQTPAVQRARLLRATADAVRQRREAIAQRIALELGKPLAQGRAEVDTAAEMFDWAAEESRRCFGQVIPTRAGGLQQRTELRPVGVVAAMSGWNAPIITPARKISGALGAGCAIVLKPSEETPGVSLLLQDALDEAGVPPGVVNLVFGDPAAIARQLIESPIVRAFSFTGGIAVGRQLGALAAQHLKRATLELGGHAPVLVFDDVDVAQVARTAALAKFRNAGQVCTSPTRICVHRRVFDVFTGAFVEQVRALRVGNPCDASVDMGPLKNPARLAAIESLVLDARQRGLAVAAGGQRLPGPGCFFEPTVIIDPHRQARVSHEEPFGPIAVLIPFETEAEAIAEANRLPVGLAAYAFTRDLARAHRLAEQVRCGSLALNDWAVSMPETPFGGVLDSGYGLEGGWQGLREFMQVVTVRTGQVGL
ncbi:MAG: NAD-dependent succinate-semialdehyde dehydrogenase [Hydrogenophaga sp.]|nr:NAD-dependent succinate-semialdehyde dehydrogenase [Hydrogenophaga sp.]